MCFIFIGIKVYKNILFEKNDIVYIIWFLCLEIYEFGFINFFFSYDNGEVFRYII